MFAFTQNKNFQLFIYTPWLASGNLKWNNRNY